MGKAAKEHRKKVQARNLRLKQEKQKREKFQRDFIMNLIKQEQEKGMFEGNSGIDGPMLDGPMLDGPMLDGPMLDGPMLDGPVLDLPITEVVESNSEVTIEAPVEEVKTETSEN